MSIPSNLYAEKVFAEHPIALWPLDDQADYVSLISNSQRDFSDSNVWQLSGGTAVPDYSLNAPIDETPTTKFTTLGDDVTVLATGLIDQNLDLGLKTISIGFHVYEDVDLTVQDRVIDTFDVSVFYDSPGKPYFNNDLEVKQTIVEKRPNRWNYYSATFELPEDETVVLDSVSVFVGTPAVFFLSDHGLQDNDRVFLSVSGTLPAGFESNTVYYVKYVDDNSFSLAATENGSGIVATQEGVNTPSITLIKKIDVAIKANMETFRPATFYFNGLTIGQWSEEFQEYSVGVAKQSAPNINLGDRYYAIPSSAYGLSESNAYYLIDNEKLLARNKNMPMVFGSKNLTSLVYDSNNNPSLIFPGSGLLNENGQYRTHTVEFWLRINANTIAPRRIFGPVASQDGLYVDGPFIILKIGDSIKSHYVGEMYRPMLFNILVYENGASITINGEKVLDMQYLTSDLNLPSNISADGKEQDWLGFYSYEEFNRFEIDCFAIYPYRVPTSVAKRRYVYGQAIDFPENITSAYNGKSFQADYTFANYGNNYVYPDIGQWKRGNVENISLEKNILAPPNYEIPSIVFDNKTSTAWYSSLERNFSNGISLRPDSSWNNTNGYIYFSDINLKERDTKAFYGVFEARIDFDGTETLFTLENQLNKNYLKSELVTSTQSVSTDGSTTIASNSHGLLDNDVVSFSGDIPAEIIQNKEYFVQNITTNTFEIAENKGESSITLSAKSFNSVTHSIRYQLKYGNDAEYTVYQTPAITLGTTFVAGIDIEKFANKFGGKVSSFVKNKSQLSLYFGGSKNFTNTFSGYMYRVGFSTRRNLQKLNYLFDNNGVPFLRYQFDGGSYLADPNSEIIDGGQAYQVFIQDILSHKASYTLFIKSDFGVLTLDIATDSSWQDYIPLQYFAKTVINRAGDKEYDLSFIQFNIDYPAPTRFDGNAYEQDRSWVKTYVSFQYVNQGANKLDSEFSNTVALNKNNVITPGSEWTNTKYEVVDGAIIYPPANVDYSQLALVVHVDMAVEGIFARPVRVKKLELAGKSLNALASNSIASKLGSDVSPFVEYGFYRDLGAFNPHSVYKGNTPYLYLTKHSGIRLEGDFPSSADRGFVVRVNKERKDTFSLAALQASFYFDNFDYLSSDLTILEIEDKSNKYFIKLSSADPTNRRAEIYATDSNGNRIDTIGFYLNGYLKTKPVITEKEWNMLSFAFVNPLDMNRRSGTIKIVGPALVNNISYYALNTLQEAQRIPNTPPFVDYSEQDYIGIDLSRLYDIYTGTNKIITGDNLVLSATEYRYSVYKDLSLQTITVKPV